MRGIILAGGKGTRLYPLTLATSKQLLPVYNKPMIYYPLCVLMLAGIREILIVTTPADSAAFRTLLGDGTAFGLTLSYAEQAAPNGLAEAFLIGREFIAGERVAMILGDNLFYGEGLAEICAAAVAANEGATILACRVDHPQRYGIVAFDSAGRVRSIEEKPQRPASNWAVTGLYFYDAGVCDLAAALTPSRRGELEITDLNNLYLSQGRLSVHRLGEGFVWFDTGTPDSLHEAASFVRAVEHRTGRLLACPEEIALHNGWIGVDSTLARAAELGTNDYADYLRAVAGRAA